MNSCAACYNTMLRKRGDFDLRIAGRLYIVRNAEYEVCEVCGEKTISPETSQDIYDCIQNHQYVEETITVPVLDCA